nr:MAG TPA: hypothetical protein [Caudoviricetes sp.]
MTFLLRQSYLLYSFFLFPFLLFLFYRSLPTSLFP